MDGGTEGQKGRTEGKEGRKEGKEGRKKSTGGKGGRRSSSEWMKGGRKRTI